MRYITYLILLMPMLSGCAITDLATGSEAEQLIALDQRAAELEDEAKEASSELIVATRAAKEVAKTGDVEAIDMAFQRVEEAAKKASLREAAFRAVIAERQELSKSIQDRTFGAVLDFVDPFLPAPIRPFTEILAALGGMLFFRRSRQGLGKSIKSLVKGNLGGFFIEVARAAGLIHTSPATAAQAETEAEMARRFALEDKLAKV